MVDIRYRVQGLFGRHGVAPGLEARIVWIMGSGRSGSTWLLNLLKSCGDVIGVDEPLVGGHLALPIDAVTGGADTSQSLVYDTERGRAQYVFSDQSRDFWAPALRRLIIARLAYEVRRAGSRQSSNALIAVKEPKGSPVAPLVMSLTPRSRLLFLVRDGRDVIDSSLDAAESAWAMGRRAVTLDAAARRDLIERRAAWWLQATAATQAAFDAHEPARRLLVHYETLRANTRPEMTRIIRWLGREPDDAAVEALVTKLAFEALPAEARGAGKFARAATPGLWRDRFSAEEKELLADRLGPTLARLGY